MCGRYNFSDIDKFFIRNAITHPVLRLEPHYNVSPGMHMPVVIRNSPNSAVLMKWGLIPFWAKDPRIGYKMINARAETIMQKASFRKPLLRQRCLVPVNSFFEWLKADGQKFPYAFTLINERIFSLAAIYDIWKDAEGYPLKTFSIITCEANKL